jgi:hypothetical protein
MTTSGKEGKESQNKEDGDQQLCINELKDRRR